MYSVYPKWGNNEPCCKEVQVYTDYQESILFGSTWIHSIGGEKSSFYNIQHCKWRDFPVNLHQENMSVKWIPPHTPLLYSKTGVCRGIPIFLFLLQNIDCGYSLEPPRRDFKNPCILHGQVFVMSNYKSVRLTFSLLWNNTKSCSSVVKTEIF